MRPKPSFVKPGTPRTPRDPGTGNPRGTAGNPRGTGMPRSNVGVSKGTVTQAVMPRQRSGIPTTPRDPGMGNPRGTGRVGLGAFMASKGPRQEAVQRKLGKLASMFKKGGAVKKKTTTKARKK